MAESHGQTGDGQRARPGNKAPQRVGLHRVNDLVLGHVGQISYKPVDEEDADAEVGDLLASRITEQRECLDFVSHPFWHSKTSLLLTFPTAPSCHHVLPFEEWISPTRTGADLPSGTTSQRTRSQKNWLLKTHPQAFLGNLGLPGLISEESRFHNADDEGTKAGSVLAVGEITDSRSTRSAAACPVVALAAGQAGHILHLSAIKPENWTWNKSTLTLGAPQSKFQGSWCSDGSPLSQIKFATKLRPFDNMRWIVAQKETSTTIFDPELRANPVTGLNSVQDPALGAASHVAMNPIVMLTADITGGKAHCDFAINMGSEEESPQLAIIDKSGNWSVWYITCTGRGRSRIIKPVLKKKGGWNWALHDPHWNETGPLSQGHGILWTSRSRRTDEWERDSDPSEDAGHASHALVSSYLTGTEISHSRFDALLVHNHTQLQIQDIGGDKPPSRLDFSRRDGRDMMLDAQPFHGSASHVFVLTTERLYLLDVSLAEDQEAEPPGILLSCHHLRIDHKEALKMSVSRLQSSHDQPCSLVLLFSAHSFRIDLFWFVISQEDGVARFHHQVLQLPDMKISDAQGSWGIQSLTAVPLSLAASKGKCRSESIKAMTNDTHFYQLFGLATDLSLSSSIVAITRGAFQHLDTPTRAVNSQWDEVRRSKFLRNKLLRDIERAFVLPDEVETDQQLSVVHKPSPQRHEVVQFRFYLLKLVQEINRGLFGQAHDGPAETSPLSHFTPVRESLQSREEHSCASLKPLLGFSNIWQPLSLAAAEEGWNLDMGQLMKTKGVGLFDCGRYGPKLSVMDLFEKMSTNWSARLPAEALKASQWRYMELALEKMAAEVYLSEQGIYMVPQSTIDLASKSLPGEGKKEIKSEDPWGDLPPSSQPKFSQTLPTPSATPSSSRATPEDMDGARNDQEDEESGQEDPAVARLRMYLPSIKFTPPQKDGPSRIISLWPEKRGVDPSDYSYGPWSKAPDAQKEKIKRRREREEDRQRRKMKQRAHLGIKVEAAPRSLSQGSVVRSSPLRLNVHSQPLGFDFGGQSQGQSQSSSQGFGFSQIMSQPVPGEFGGRPRVKKKKLKEPPKIPGFK